MVTSSNELTHALPEGVGAKRRGIRTAIGTGLTHAILSDSVEAGDRWLAAEVEALIPS